MDDHSKDDAKDGAKDGAKGDPPVTHIEFTALPEAPPKPLIDDSRVTLHAHVLRHCLAAQRVLLGLASLDKIIAYLTKDFPADFAAPGAELLLHDPEGRFRDALAPRSAPQRRLSFPQDSYPLYELFEGDPQVVPLSLDDPRMFRILGDAKAADGAVLLPLLDGSRLIGVYQLALADGLLPLSDHDRLVLASLAQLASSSLLRAFDAIGADRRARVDPVTGLGNSQALLGEIEREIARARRQGHSLAMLRFAVDDLDDVLRSRGEAGTRIVLRHVAQCLLSRLRSTDVIARVAPAEFSVLLTACGEPQAHDIASRLCDELKASPVDDGRGAVFDIALSVGLVCWDSMRHPVQDSARLSAQLRQSADEALARVVRGGGDGIAVARIGALMV